MTNGERIKSMNYWQLVHFIHRCMWKYDCEHCPAHAPGCAFRCKQRWLEWLKEEVIIE